MLNEIMNIYECGLRDGKKGLTQTEAIHRIVEKINLLIGHFNLLETNCNKSIEDFNEKIYYYLNNGLVDEVSKKLDQFSKDGTLNDIINKQILNDIKNNIKDIQNDLISFRKTYENNKVVTDKVIEMFATDLSKEITSIKNDYTTIQTVIPDDGGIVKKYIMEDNKMAKIRRKYIHCQLSAQQWQQAWEDLGSGGSNNNNGSIWVPFYWSVNKNNIIDSDISLKDLNKWVWQSLGYSKIGVYGLGYINETGCYVYVENKAPTEQTIGIAFTVTITEKYN